MIPGFSQEFLIPEISVLEKIVRPLIVYVFLLVAFRVAGKRQLGEMTPFDLIVLLTISNLLQNAMIGADNSLTGGLIGAITILVANYVLAYLTFKFPWLDRLVEGDATLLIDNGKVLWKNLEKELLSENDLRQVLARSGIDFETDLKTLKRVEIDPDGQIAILRKTSSSMDDHPDKKRKVG